MNPYRANERVRPLVQDLNSVFKGTTYLLILKRVEVNFFLDPMSLVIHLVLPLKWEACRAIAVKLSSPLYKSKDNSM